MHHAFPANTLKKCIWQAAALFPQPVCHVSLPKQRMHFSLVVSDSVAAICVTAVRILAPYSPLAQKEKLYICFLMISFDVLVPKYTQHIHIQACRFFIIYMHFIQLLCACNSKQCDCITFTHSFKGNVMEFIFKKREIASLWFNI